MNNGKRGGGFGSFLLALLILAVLTSAALVGYKTYQKLPVVRLVGEMGEAVKDLDLDRIGDCFTPDSDVKKAVGVMSDIGNTPFLGDLAGGVASLIGSAFDFQVDYSDIRIIVSGNFGEAIVGVVDNKGGQKKNYVTFNLKKLDGKWQATGWPETKSADNTDLSYKNTLVGYSERASDYASLLIYGAQQK